MRDKITKLMPEVLSEGRSEARESNSCGKLGTGGPASGPREIHQNPTKIENITDETGSAGARMDLAGDPITEQHEPLWTNSKP